MLYVGGGGGAKTILRTDFGSQKYFFTISSIIYQKNNIYYIEVFVYVEVKFLVFSFGSLPQPFQLILLEVFICPPWTTNTASEKEAMRARFHN